ncbi:MAG: hypothetical protein VB093_04405 [Propionicimonas sp.]|nr:hypothetical protein [Propionicimonas sp.]MEA5117151.1 hypothetical protein [Propionicimonas sp.]
MLLLSACSSPAAPAIEAVEAAAPAASSAPASAAPVAPSPAPPSPTIEVTPAITLADTVPDGAWSGSDKVTKVKGNVKGWWDPPPKKGNESTGDPWVFNSTCTDTLCTGTITRASDDGLPARDFTWDGTALTITRPAFEGSWECQTDGIPNGESWDWAVTWTYKTTVKTDADGRVTTITVDSTLTGKGQGKTNKKLCGDGVKPGSQTLRSTVTPVS